MSSAKNLTYECDRYLLHWAVTDARYSQSQLHFYLSARLYQAVIIGEDISPEIALNILDGRSTSRDDHKDHAEDS